MQFSNTEKFFELFSFKVFHFKYPTFYKTEISVFHCTEKFSISPSRYLLRVFSFEHYKAEGFFILFIRMTMLSFGFLPL